MGKFYFTNLQVADSCITKLDLNYLVYFLTRFCWNYPLYGIVLDSSRTKYFVFVSSSIPTDSFMVFLNLMADNQNRRLVTCADDDIITNLPDHPIDLILERLPIKDAVRTSILSKKWRYRWTTMRALSFFYEFSKDFLEIGAYTNKGFIRIINLVMIHHKGPILKFRLHIPNIYLDSFQEVDQWMLILSRKDVRVLVIINSNQIYLIPSSMFSCLELRTLQLYRCILNPPLDFRGFPNLEHLYLTRTDFGGNLGGIVINLPRLKNLKLDSCTNVKNFNITAVNLSNLTVSNCPDAMLLQLMHSKHLFVVRICLMKPTEDLQRVERFNLATMLSSLTKLVHFTIDGYFLKFLASEKFPKCLSGAVRGLQYLEFLSFSFSDLDQVHGALCMLRYPPKLKVLRLTHVEMGDDADLGFTSSYLECPDCLNQTLLMLQTVEITSLEGTRPELLFIKLLLDHSPQLEKMIIRPKATADADKRLNIAKDVMMFPRASTKAKIAYLDPQP